MGEGLETLAAPVKLLDAPNAKPLQITQATVEFNNVTHHYGREMGGVDNLILRVEAGQKVGLVGRSGAGKSTLFKLLLRFYDAESGQILIDGQDISQVTQDSLRHKIGMVQQESSLLHRSIRENILYGREGASDTLPRHSRQRRMNLSKRLRINQEIRAMIQRLGNAVSNYRVGNANGSRWPV
ncbi:MAG: ATP-binding cassette domain-containing protein [Rhodobacteraceae bacterium]|nr:ATP-binding cassette domain-containing protein [Paracoccaceae bacterium]